jgi:hypothetical protein
MGPGLSWLAIINPNNPAYAIECTPLYAIAPVLARLAPIIVLSLIITFVRLFLWIVAWLLRLADIIAQILQVLRG